MSARPAILVTGNDLAPQALALLGDYDVVYAGPTPSESDIVVLCARYDPVAIIVRLEITRGQRDLLLDTYRGKGPGGPAARKWMRARGVARTCPDGICGGARRRRDDAAMTPR